MLGIAVVTVSTRFFDKRILNIWDSFLKFLYSSGHCESGTSLVNFFPLLLSCEWHFPWNTQQWPAGQSSCNSSVGESGQFTLPLLSPLSASIWRYALGLFAVWLADLSATSRLSLQPFSEHLSKQSLYMTRGLSPQYTVLVVALPNSLVWWSRAISIDQPISDHFGAALAHAPDSYCRCWGTINTGRIANAHLSSELIECHRTTMTLKQPRSVFLKLQFVVVHVRLFRCFSWLISWLAHNCSSESNRKGEQPW